MNKRMGYFVKINFKNCMKCSVKDFNLLKKNKPNSKYLLYAGVLNKDGTTIVFRADDEKEAIEIALTNPYTDFESYNYQIIKNDYISLVC